METDKKTVEALIDRLADKTLKTGCIVETHQYSHIEGLMTIVYEDTFSKGDWRVVSGKSTFYQNEQNMTIIGNPVMIGDVLEKIKIQKNDGIISNYYKKIFWHQVLTEWRKFSFTKSLNEIVEESGYEKVCMNCVRGHDCECGCGEEEPDLKECIKNDQARGLVEFILSLNL